MLMANTRRSSDFSEKKQERRASKFQGLRSLAVVGGKGIDTGDEDMREPPSPPRNRRASSDGGKEPHLDFEPCCTCGKTITRGYIGRWGDGGTCSVDCEKKQQAKPLDYGEPKVKTRPTHF
jgi:hypothetical protein